MKRWGLLGKMVVLILVGGCGMMTGSGEVTGVVEVDGEPAPGFQITFTSTRDPDLVIRGLVGEEGKFRLSRGRGKLQVPAGEYVVTLAPSAVGEQVPKSKISLPQKYRDVSQAGLIQTVKRGENHMMIGISSSD